ncbi:lipoyl synthase [Candidatus Omnitrophota bacterium]
MRKPSWLDKKIDLEALAEVQRLVKGLRLHTVCEEAKCPNIGECFRSRTATFLLLGDRCTRDCRFCAVKPGEPRAPDETEPQRVAQAVRRLGLDFVVLTSVCRDDLVDKGLWAFVETIEEIRKNSPRIHIETLVPDFAGRRGLIARLAASAPDIISHNLETVSDLYSSCRPQASYRRSLDLLRLIKAADKDLRTKSGIMLGLGESRHQVIEVFRDLREAGCDRLSIGQYLAPSSSHLEVKEYIPPEAFRSYEHLALEMGFEQVVSSPYARTSYRGGS